MLASVLAVKARRAMFIVAPRGTGKSQVIHQIARHLDEKLVVDTLTAAGLSPLEQELTNTNRAILMDDLGKLSSQYRRVSTCANLVSLCHDSYVTSYTHKQALHIEGFRGSLIIGAQPSVYKDIVLSQEYTSVIADKSIAYFHLFRPQTVNTDPLKVRINWGVPLADTYKPNESLQGLDFLYKLFRSQWTPGRCFEHRDALLRASAALDGRKRANSFDVKLITWVFRPMQLQTSFIDSQGFEGERRTNTDLLYILSEFLSYGTFTAEMIASDFMCSQRTAQRILANFKSWVVKVDLRPDVYSPGEPMKALMHELRDNIKELI